MKTKGILFVLMLNIGCFSSFAKNAITKISFDATEEISRADFYISKVVENPVAVLVLAPGRNGNGKQLIENKKWRQFAKEHSLLLIGVSLASDNLRRDRRYGYYYADRESGDMLLDAITQAGAAELPILLYGFSGGAYFSSRFAAYKPGRVLGFCASSASYWDDPIKNEVRPPALLASGDEDGSCFGPTLMHFKKGRATGQKWSWVTVPRTGHHSTPEWNDFVRSYFTAMLLKEPKECWVDIGTEELLTDPNSVHPALTAWLPDESLLQPWRNLHEH